MPTTIGTTLLVDDDAEFRQRMARALRERGVDVIEAFDAHSGWASAQQCVPKQAVIDLNMPGPSGMDLVELLHRNYPSLRIFVLTGYGSIASAVKAMQLGASSYLTKPVHADELHELLSAPQVLLPPNEEKSSNAPSLEEVEWEHIQRVLLDCDGNITKAATILGIHRRSLQRKLARVKTPKSDDV